MKGDPVYLWMSDGCAWIRVVGEGSRWNSTEVKTFAREKINEGVRQFMVDMEECSAVDSTFMGTLAGTALRLQQLGAPTVSLRLLNTHPEIRKLFENLGLDQLFHV